VVNLALNSSDSADAQMLLLLVVLLLNGLEPVTNALVNHLLSEFVLFINVDHNTFSWQFVTILHFGELIAICAISFVSFSKIYLHPNDA